MVTLFKNKGPPPPPGVQNLKKPDTFRGITDQGEQARSGITSLLPVTPLPNGVTGAAMQVMSGTAPGEYNSWTICLSPWLFLLEPVWRFPTFLPDLINYFQSCWLQKLIRNWQNILQIKFGCRCQVVVIHAFHRMHRTWCAGALARNIYCRGGYSPNNLQIIYLEIWGTINISIEILIIDSC